eukprot:PhF_6_TR37066/c0_g1_i2/m.54287
MSIADEVDEHIKAVYLQGVPEDAKIAILGKEISSDMYDAPCPQHNKHEYISNIAKDMCIVAMFDIYDMYNIRKIEAAKASKILAMFRKEIGSLRELAGGGGEKKKKSPGVVVVPFQMDAMARAVGMYQAMFENKDWIQELIASNGEGIQETLTSIFTSIFDILEGLLSKYSSDSPLGLYGAYSREALLRALASEKIGLERQYPGVVIQSQGIVTTASDKQPEPYCVVSTSTPLLRRRPK